MLPIMVNKSVNLLHYCLTASGNPEIIKIVSQYCNIN
jgi:hypothetical protein